MTVGEFKTWLAENEVPEDYELYVNLDPFHEGAGGIFPERALNDPSLTTTQVGILLPQPTTLNVVMFK